MSNSTEVYKRRYREEYDTTEEEKKTSRKHRRSSNLDVAEPDAGKYIFVVNAEKVNIRERPSLQAKVLKIVNKGDKLELISGRIVKGFYIVNYDDGKQGFIHSDYASFV